MRLQPGQPRRTAFTLVEMMVAMALTVFILVILSQAFGTGMETFRQLKAIGDMQEGLRVAAVRLRTDLSYDHFEARRRLSDPNFWVPNPSNPGTGGKPLMGFFLVKQGSPSVSEGLDLDGVPSLRATNHVLWFSIKLRGNRRENFLTANVPAGSPLLTPANTSLVNYPADAQWQQGGTTYNTQWAEVAYYLVQTGSTVEPNNPAATSGTPLFTLFRAQRVVVPNNVNLSKLVSTAGASAYSDVSCEADPNNAGALYFNTPTDMARGTRAISFPDASQAPLLPNVVSFQVQIMQGGTQSFIDVPAASGGGFVFDTGATTSPTYTISALQITIRVWDPKSEQTREITVIQDL